MPMSPLSGYFVVVSLGMTGERFGGGRRESGRVGSGLKAARGGGANDGRGRAVGGTPSAKDGLGGMAEVRGRPSCRAGVCVI